MSQSTRSAYEARFPDLVRVAAKLCCFLEERLGEAPRVERVSARAKAPNRFVAKAQKIEDGERKYVAPLTQIQDQIGARVVVYYLDDVPPVADAVERYFRHVERKNHVPDSYWEFGYFGRHWILALPDDVIPQDVEKDSVPRFFELQVKTLFQHAWSETNHDLSYKSPTPLTADQLRRCAFTAAQAWGADQILNDLISELECFEPP